MRTLLECLVDYDTALLRAIAERRGVELTTSHQPEMAQQIADALLEPEFISEALEWLTPEERRALDTLLASGGRMRMHRFEQQWGEIRRFGPGALSREAPWRSPASPAEGLWYRGLIARSFADEAGTVVEFVFVPTDLRPLLPVPHMDLPPFDVPGADEPYRVRVGDPAAVDDVCTLLVLAHRGLLRQHAGELMLGSVDHARTQFLDGDEARVQFLWHIARTAGLMRAHGSAVQLSRERARDWLGQPRAQQLRVLQEAWRGSTDWNDLWHVPGIRCEATGWRNDPVAARLAVLELQSRCPRDVWLSLMGFVDMVRDRVPDYLRPDGDFDSWYIRDVRTGEYLTGFKHWDRVEGALLTYLLTGPLHWLGVVSLGYREHWEKPSAFRLTAWGAAFLGLPHSGLHELPPQPAHVAPDAVAAIPREASLSDRFQLARIAEWQSSGGEYVYALTPTSLGRALSDGVELERIERFLARISGDSVPASALARIRSWASRYGDVHLRRAVILETRTARVMKELRAHDRIRGYLRQAISPTMAVVREVDWDILIQELHQAGYLPEITDR
jgi:hypothetical protein